MLGADMPPRISQKRHARDVKNSRMGCATCKVRHIKCDETKPACVRCSSSGRICDGYPSFESVARNIKPGLVQRRKESRYFDVFQHKTILGLMGFDHGSTFWRCIVLQLSQSSPAVLHASLALGALHEYQDGGLNATRDTQCLQLCLMQYNKSIRDLRSRQSRQPIQLTLTCCILFICLENALGNHDTALAHLQNGLNILKYWKVNANRSASEDLVAENLAQVLRRLDMQATVFLDSRQPELNVTSVVQNPKSDHSVCSHFSSMRDAQISLEEIELRLLYVLTAKPLHNHSGQSHIDMVSVRAPLLRGLEGRFKDWKNAFDSFSIRESEKLKTKDLQLGVLLALHYETTTLMLDMKARMNPDLENISSWESKITRINTLSRSLINSTPSGSKFTFSADTGVIAPLYFAAMNANSSPVRQQAIDILHSVKWKEGFWDAGTAAKIAENVFKVKTAGTIGLPVTGGIPVLAKAHCIVTF